METLAKVVPLNLPKVLAFRLWKSNAETSKVFLVFLDDLVDQRWGLDGLLVVPGVGRQQLLLGLG